MQEKANIMNGFQCEFRNQGIVLFAFIALLCPQVASANPTVKQYLEVAGLQAKLVPHGKLRIAGRSMNCGRRPTVYDPDFIDYGGAYPGFIILNPRMIKRLPIAVQRYVFAHECGHQFRGGDEAAADCFAVKRGRRQGWLSAKGLDRICHFMMPHVGDSMHPPGPKRCSNMRFCYKNAIKYGVNSR